MITYLLIITGVAALAVYAAWHFRKKAKAEKKRANKYAGEIDRLTHVIKRIEEVNRETAKKKKKLRTGSDSDKFDNSLDILSELARGANGSD